MRNFAVRFCYKMPAFVMLLTALLAASSVCFAQLNSNTATVTLTATLSETLTVAATPSTVTFALVSGGTATGSAPVAITTTWVLAAGRANVILDGYFASAAAALASSAPVTNIPTSEVLGQMTTGTPTSYTAFTQTAALGPSGAGLTLFTQALSSSNRASNRTDNLNLEINLASQAQLPAGTYTGTLTLQAQAL
jgi:hypothetical protein